MLEGMAVASNGRLWIETCVPTSLKDVLSPYEKKYGRKLSPQYVHQVGTVRHVCRGTRTHELSSKRERCDTHSPERYGE